MILSDPCLIGSFKTSFNNLKLNVVTGDSINFLDLLISFDRVTCRLLFKPFFKATKTFNYLLTTSNHPDFIYKNIPKSLFIRYRRNCSRLSDFFFFSSILKYQLINRDNYSR